MPRKSHLKRKGRVSHPSCTGTAKPKTTTQARTGWFGVWFFWRFVVVVLSEPTKTETENEDATRTQRQDVKTTTTPGSEYQGEWIQDEIDGF
jgi:hypothetical protein